MRISIKTDLGGVYNSIQENKTLATFVMTQQVVKDSNFFAPEDTGALMNSALMASDFDAGKAIWDVPYAKKLYFNPSINFSTDKNPNAQAFWFETAKSAYLSDWVKMAQSEVNRNV